MVGRRKGEAMGLSLRKAFALFVLLVVASALAFDGLPRPAQAADGDHHSLLRIGPEVPLPATRGSSSA